MAKQCEQWPADPKIVVEQWPANPEIMADSGRALADKSRNGGEYRSSNGPQIPNSEPQIPMWWLIVVDLRKSRKEMEKAGSVC